jgi:predicted AlkP superfamily phosphohydrolase/phosphomutase
MVQKIEKVIILGIDAIEFDLIEKWNLNNLKQKEYGKTIVPKSAGQEPATEIIWPCFITGEEPEEMGYSSLNIYSKSLKTIMPLISPVIRKLFLNTKTKNGTQKIQGRFSLLYLSIILLKKVGLIHKPTKDDIKAETIFDNKKIKSIHLHIPILDKDAFPEYRKNIINAISEKLHHPIVEIKQKNEFTIRSKEVYDCIKKNNWQLFMQYYFVLDGVQHIFYRNHKKIAKFYLMFDEFIKKVSEIIDDETLLLIVSDHGLKKGIHTPYGFYSVNKKLGLKNPKLIDFRGIIEEILVKA